MKNCEDEPAADKFVTDCQKICDSIYEAGSELSPAQEKDLHRIIYQAMLYKVGKIDTSLCGCCCVTRFTKRGTFYAERVYNRFKIYILIVLVINVAVQLALTILDQSFEASLYPGMPVEKIIEHRNKVDFPLMALQVVFGVFNVWQILAVVQFQ